MRTNLKIKLHKLLESFFPERRVFLKSDNDTRFIRLRSGTQLIALAGSSLIVAWTIVATAIILMDSIGAGNFREQAKRDQTTYKQTPIHAYRYTHTPISLYILVYIQVHVCTCGNRTP